MVNLAGSLLQTLLNNLSASQPEGFEKLSHSLASLTHKPSQHAFFYLFAICPRWFEKQKTSKNDALKLDDYDPFQVLQQWEHAQAARLVVLLSLANSVDQATYVTAINELFKTADVNEQILLVQSLRFIPHGECFVERAREAARSNIESVFSAVAHRNTFASLHFDSAGWNQLILKAAFLAVPIWSIEGLRARNNEALITMLHDYSLERHAASRAVPWDLYCCIGWQCSTDKMLAYLEHEFTRSNARIRAAIALSLQENPHSTAQPLATILAKNVAQTHAPQHWPTIASMGN